MVPIEIHKEKAGYVLNTLLVPFLRAALELVAGGYAEPGDVDNTWRIGTGVLQVHVALCSALKLLPRLRIRRRYSRRGILWRPRLRPRAPPKSVPGPPTPRPR